MANIVYFISGHRNISDKEFNDNYAKKLKSIEDVYNNECFRLKNIGIEWINPSITPLYVVGGL